MRFNALPEVEWLNLGLRCSSSIAGHGQAILATQFSPSSSSRMASGSGDNTVGLSTTQETCVVNCCLPEHENANSQFPYRPGYGTPIPGKQAQFFLPVVVWNHVSEWEQRHDLQLIEGF